MTDLQTRPILYIDKQNMDRQLVLLKNHVIVTTALSWENEEVYHISFSETHVGNKIQSYFITEEMNIPECRFPSIICYRDKAKAYLLTDTGVTMCELNFVPGKSELYSRSKGLLETDLLETKHVLIIGLGSFGSFIAVELAKAGIGKFTLIDFDRIEPSNIARHVCGIADLGRLKVHALRDIILQKNPYAIIKTGAYDINEHLDKLESAMKTADIVICTTDNNRSRFNINDHSISLDKIVLYGRAITRAEGGDVFRMKGKSGPCYCCLIGDDGKIKYNADEEISSSRQTGDLPAYVSQQDRDAMIQPGLSSDILPMCNLMVKLALIELSEVKDSELSYPFYLWGNRREKNYLNWAAFDKQDNKRPTILRWYGVKVPKDPDCSVCS
jgi:molybdopterin/thiamine biosynthesis adenylyltransferase